MLANVLIGLGVAFLFLAALGTVRLPDAYARMHAGSKATTLGLALTMIGATVALGELHVGLLLAVAVQLVAAPLATHALGRSAHHARIPVSDRFVVDELQDEGEAPPGELPSRPVPGNEQPG